MKKVLASYIGPVKGLKPYLLSLMYANVVPFEHKQKATSGKVARGENRDNVVSFIIPEKESDGNEVN